MGDASRFLFTDFSAGAGTEKVRFARARLIARVGVSSGVDSRPVRLFFIESKVIELAAASASLMSHFRFLVVGPDSLDGLERRVKLWIDRCCCCGRAMVKMICVNKVEL